MNEILEQVIARQQQLISALDGRDAEAIEAATADLADALGALAAEGGVHGVAPQRLDHALRQAQAARIRVNLLSEWTRQRIDRLSQLRSGPSLTYSKKAVLAPVP